VALITPIYFIYLQATREIKKYLWEIIDDDGHLHTGQEDIKIEVVNYFSNFFNEHRQSNVRTQMVTIRLYPRIVLEEDVTALEHVVTLE
jgi:hypothetical protein